MGGSILALPWMESLAAGPTKEVAQRLAFYYGEIVPKNQQFGITVWGFRDQDSWIYEGGTDWPLLYDNNFEPKPAYDGFRNGLDGQAP